MGITVDLKIRELIAKRDENSVAYDIQTLRPKVMSLCGRIKSLPVNSAKDRLCQSEIAKKMAHLTRVVLDLDSNVAEIKKIKLRFWRKIWHNCHYPMIICYKNSELSTEFI